MRGEVYYNSTFKIIAIVLFGFSWFVLYAALHASDDQTYIALTVAAFFLVASAYLFYQAFFVKFSYDDEALYFGKKQEKLLWRDLKEKGYSHLLDMNYLVFDGFGRIWLSLYMHGIDDLGDFLAEKTKAIDEEGYV